MNFIKKGQAQGSNSFCLTFFIYEYKVIFDVLTIFPELIKFYISESIVKRAEQKGLVETRVTNIRDFAFDKHSVTDDYQYGGGPGMVMKIEPIYHALKHIKSDGIKRRSILLTPEGYVYNQRKAESLLEKKEDIILICGRYEGIDDRVGYLIDEEISVGDFVLTGGELASLVIIDSITRLIPGVLGCDSSKEEESFTTGLLDYPHYTRPSEFKGMKVPEVLMSGNHRQIGEWRKRESLRKTLLKKSYLIEQAKFTNEENKIINDLKEELENESH